jgi:3-(3-hydroxy-phenyl)propionate hydroxylase
MLRRIGALRVVLRSRGNPDAAQDGVVTLVAQDGLYEQWLDETGTAAAVVRPDRYVYGAGRTNQDLARLVDKLSGALFRPSS